MPRKIKKAKNSPLYNTKSNWKRDKETGKMVRTKKFNRATGKMEAVTPIKQDAEISRRQKRYSHGTGAGKRSGTITYVNVEKGMSKRMKKEFDQVMKTGSPEDQSAFMTKIKRMGYGMKGQKKYARQDGVHGGTSGVGAMVGSTIDGALNVDGWAQYRDLSDEGTINPTTGKREWKSQSNRPGWDRVILQDSPQWAKRAMANKRSYKIEAALPTADMSDLKRLKPREKVKTASTLTPKGQTAGKPSAKDTTPKLKKKETAPLKMRPVTSRVGR